MEIVLQIFFNSLVSAIILSLMSVGFSYIFNVTKVFHLAHAAAFSMGGLLFWKLTSLGLFWPVAILAVVFISVIVMFLMEKTVYYPMIRQKSDPSVTLIASMGGYIVIVNILALFFGNDNKINTGASETYQVLCVIISSTQIIQLITSIILLFLLAFFLKYSKLDVTIRAISINATLGEVFGINSKKVRYIVITFGTVLAVIAGILAYIEIGIEPYSGMNITLTAAVVAILVSKLKFRFIIIACIVLSLLQNCIEWFLNAQWKEGVTFAILLVVILFKTEGLVSYKLRKS